MKFLTLLLIRDWLLIFWSSLWMNKMICVSSCKRKKRSKTTFVISLNKLEDYLRKKRVKGTKSFCFVLIVESHFFFASKVSSILRTFGELCCLPIGRGHWSVAVWRSGKWFNTYFFTCVNCIIQKQRIKFWNCDAFLFGIFNIVGPCNSKR